MADTPKTTAPTSRPRRRWLRRLVVFVVLLLGLVVVAPLGLGLSPVRRFVAGKVSTALGRTVTIGGISAAWWSGMELRNVEVHNPEGYTGDPLLAVDRVKVDVSLGKLLTGTFDARVAVERPVVTLIQDKDGHSNLEGLGTKREGEPRERSGGSPPHLVLTVRDGRLVAYGTPGAQAGKPDVIDALTVDAELQPSGEKTLRVSATARGARVGGGDADLKIDARLDARGGGPVTMSVPSLDLARFAKAAGSALGVEGLVGSAQMEANLVLDPVAGGTGTAKASLENVTWRKGAGSVSMRSATFQAAPSRAGDATHFEVEGRVVSLTVDGGPGTTTYTEPSATLTLKGSWEGGTKTLVLSKAQVGAGALRASNQGPITIRTESSVTMDGSFTADADLTRLAGLSVLVPSLSSVQGGTVHAEIVAKQASDLAVRALVTGKDLAFTPGTLSTRGYLERDVALEVRVVRPASGATTIEIVRLQSAMVSLGATKAPLTVRLADEGPAIDGVGTLTVNVSAVGIAFDKALGLAPGTTISGFLDLSTSGKTSSTGAEFDVKLVGRDLVLPGARTRGTLDGGAKIRTDAKAGTTFIEGLRLRGYGLDVQGGARMNRTASGGSELATATFDVKGDLDAAKPLLSIGLASLADATLSGRLASHIELTAASPGRRLDGRTTITRLQYAGSPDPKTGKSTTLTEPTVSIEHRLALDAEPGLVRIEKLTLVAEALTASVTGTSRTRGDDRDLSLDVKVDGDAARIADDLKAALGEGYEDMAGEGKVAGKFVVVGPTANDSRDLRIDGDLTFIRFASGGLTVENGHLVIARPAPGTPLTVGVTAKVNHGTLQIESACELGKGESPWKARITMRGVDTSPIVTGAGSGRYLALVLPAIVPSSASSAALSGLLDADLDLQAAAIRQPRLADTLSGPGAVRMTQGSVKESTLFQGLSGGGGSGVSPLLKLVPGLGKDLEALSQALLFQELSSAFTLGNRLITLNPVTLVSPSMELKFTGVVGFDGATELRIPLRLSGAAGLAIAPYVKDQTIPLKVSQKAKGSMKVTPDLKLENLGTGLIDDLFGKKKKKPK